MQQRVCQTKVHDMDELKQRLFDVGWHGFKQSVIEDATMSGTNVSACALVSK